MHYGASVERGLHRLVELLHRYGCVLVIGDFGLLSFLYLKIKGKLLFNMRREKEHVTK